MRDASGPSPSLKGSLAAPPLQACASPPTATSVPCAWSPSPTSG